MKFPGVIPPVLLLGCLLASGCSHSDTHASSTSLKYPPWVQGRVEIPGKMCAVGSVGRTFYQEDANKYGEEVARRNLSFAMFTHVQALQKSVTGTRGQYHGGTYSVETAKWATDCAFEKASLEGSWIDEKGVVSGGASNMTYSLVCIDKTEIAKCRRKK